MRQGELRQAAVSLGVTRRKTERTTAELRASCKRAAAGQLSLQAMLSRGSASRGSADNARAAASSPSGVGGAGEVGVGVPGAASPRAAVGETGGTAPVSDRVRAVVPNKKKWPRSAIRPMWLRKPDKRMRPTRIRSEKRMRSVCHQPQDRGTDGQGRAPLLTAEQTACAWPAQLLRGQTPRICVDA